MFELQFKRDKSESIWVTVRLYDAAELIKAITRGKSRWVLESIREQQGEGQ